MPVDKDPLPPPLRHPGVLSRQDVEARILLARRRPRWQERTRGRLRDLSGAAVTVAALVPIVLAIGGTRIVAGLGADGWARLLGLPLLAVAGIAVWLEVLYLRRPVQRLDPTSVITGGERPLEP